MAPVDYDHYRRVAAIERSRARSKFLRAAGRAVCKGVAWIAERFHAKGPAQRVRHHVRGQGSLSVSR